jgi:diacylglycerol kinase (ATP)
MMADAFATMKHSHSGHMNDSHPQISEFKSKSGLKRILGAIRYSLAGLRTAWKSEHAFRQELMVVVPGCIIALLVSVPALHKIALIAVLILVLIVELINSAIEAVVDRISFERHLIPCPRTRRTLAVRLFSLH